MKVSIIIPCYNVEKYLPKCKDCVENQSFPDLEIICVDDGSTDGTLEFLNSWEKESNLDIKIFHQENRGACSARNRGVENATGQYFQFYDADDILFPDKIENQVKIAESTDFPDIVVGSFNYKEEKGKSLGIREYSPIPDEEIFVSLMKTDLGLTSSNLFRAGLFKEGFKWGEKQGSSQEYLLMFQILKKRIKIAFDSEVNTWVVARKSGSISKSNAKYNWERFVRLRLSILNHHKKVFPEVNHEVAQQTLFDAMRMLYKFNQPLALELYEQNFPKDFLPIESEGTKPNYIRIFRFMGFRNTERLKSCLSFFSKDK